MLLISMTFGLELKLGDDPLLVCPMNDTCIIQDYWN